MARKLTLATFIMLFIATAYSARPFNAYVSDGLAAVETSLNIVTTSDTVAFVPEKELKHLLPCPCDGNMAFSGTELKTKTTTLRKLKGAYHTLVLNSLPKGRIPSSGPSKRTHSLNN